MKTLVFWVEAWSIPNREVTAYENKRTVLSVNSAVAGKRELKTLPSAKGAGKQLSLVEVIKLTCLRTEMPLYSFFSRKCVGMFMEVKTKLS